MSGGWRGAIGVRRALLLFLCAVCGSFAYSSGATADPQRPLVIDGKKTLFQRVITRPRARLHASTPEGPEREVLPFSVYYVYGRRRIGDQIWLEVGEATQPPTAGWLLASQTVEWRQSLTVSFNTSISGRSKVLFFRQRDDVHDLLKSSNMPTAAKRLLNEAERKDPSPDSPLIAIEPEESIDIGKNFYLLPILDFDAVADSSDNNMRLLKIASIPLDRGAKLQPPKTAEPVSMKDFKAGVVFVIDTTLSMGPYIDRTREAVRRMYDIIRDGDPDRRFHFGLIAFRSNLTAAPKLEYLTKQFHKLDPNEDPGAFLPDVENIVESKISSARFDEDSFAGVKAALDLNDWSKFDGRYIVLITDAGSFDATDPLSSTRLSATGLRQIAQSDRAWPVAIFALHLLSPEGVKDHAYAARQYQELTIWPNAEPGYFPVAKGSPEAFSEQTDRLARVLGIQAQVAAEKLRASLPPALPGTVDEKIERQAAIVGNAMRLAYLGRKMGTAAPDMFEAWTVDHDLAQPTQASLDVRVLLTKNQLSDLSDGLKLILEAARAQRTSPQDFFNQLRQAALAASRDPRQLGHVDKLSDLIGEYLDGLPYRSEILEVTEDDWQAMGVAAREEKLNSVDEKLRLYQSLNEHPRLWTSFDGGRVPGDAVYPMKLDMLP